jgi:hypothetical protein
MEIEYEYMTLAIKDLMNKFQTKYWMIPDNPPPGVIPPTIDEIKEMFFKDMTLMQPFSNHLWTHIHKEIPDGWELVDKRLDEDKIKLHTSRSFGPLGWVTHIEADSYEFQVRRPIK